MNASSTQIYIDIEIDKDIGIHIDIDMDSYVRIYVHRCAWTTSKIHTCVDA